MQPTQDYYIKKLTVCKVQSYALYDIQANSPISGQKATTKVCGCIQEFSRVCAFVVGGAQATTRAMVNEC